MTDGDALLAAILAHPAEDTPRLVYADWLQENGQEDRAEFVRVQCELARGPDGIDCELVEGDGARYDCWPVVPTRPPLGERASARVRSGSTWTLLSGTVCAWCSTNAQDRRGFSLTDVRGEQWKPELGRRERELFAANGPNQLEWMGRAVHDLCVAGSEWLDHLSWFRRAFVDCVTCPAADWLAHGDAVLAQQPVARVIITLLLGEHLQMRSWPERWPGVAFQLLLHVECLESAFSALTYQDLLAAHYDTVIQALSVPPHLLGPPG